MITIEAAPWVSWKVIGAASREVKRKVSGIRRYRRIEKKGLQMIRFVARYDEPPTGRRLLEVWKNTERVKKNPKWSYDEGRPGESSRFWRDYYRARRALAYTKLPKPGGG
jgi:hypothetical protein